MLVGNGNANLSILRAGLNIVSGDCVAVSWALMALLKMVEATELEEAAEEMKQRREPLGRGEEVLELFAKRMERGRRQAG